MGRYFTAALALLRKGTPAMTIIPERAERPEPVDDTKLAAERAKFELAPPEVLLDSEKVRSIPWGYGRDKITAMAVDPERLYTYWEVTDEGIARARDELGLPGDHAPLCLRVHDVTSILFDGTNANHVFDVPIGRSDRQWFMPIGRPGSTVIVEVGLKSGDGRFAKIARSKRVDFPRREPMHSAPAEWLTVHVVPSPQGRPQLHAERVAPAPPADPPADGGHSAGATAEFETAGAPWQWIGPQSDAHFETGTFPVDLGPLVPGEVQEYFQEYFQEYVRELETGETSATALAVGATTSESWQGGPQVRHGPWRVTLKHFGPRGGRVLATWRIEKSWTVGGGRERVEVRGVLRRRVARGPGSASEQAYEGASEHYWLGGSEEWLGGASELQWFGASENMYAGASERAWRGASERRLAGASERRLQGASEHRLQGASERRSSSAGQRPLGGASEGGVVPPAAPAKPPFPPLP